MMLVAAVSRGKISVGFWGRAYATSVPAQCQALLADEVGHESAAQLILPARVISGLRWMDALNAVD
jgi:hypothetical protein